MAEELELRVGGAEEEAVGELEGLGLPEGDADSEPAADAVEVTEADDELEGVGAPDPLAEAL